MQFLLFLDLQQQFGVLEVITSRLAGWKRAVKTTNFLLNLQVFILQSRACQSGFSGVTGYECLHLL